MGNRPLRHLIDDVHVIVQAELNKQKKSERSFFNEGSS